MTKLIAHERLINLALAFISAQKPLNAQEILHNPLIGYDTDISISSFKRMFSRDKEQLAQSGIIIKTLDDDRYELDKNASYASDLELDPVELASVRAIAYALLEDPEYPYAQELRFALAKLSQQIYKPISLEEEAKLLDSPLDELSLHTKPTHIPNDKKNESFNLIHQAIRSRKFLYFSYTNAQQVSSDKSVCPLALFTVSKVWYLIAALQTDDIRVFRVDRMENIQINTKAPLTPDFDEIEFNMYDYIGLPFMYGNETYTARLACSSKEAWRINHITKHKGTLEHTIDKIIWSVEVKNTDEFCKFIAAQEIPFQILSPDSLKQALKQKLQKVVKMHGSSFK